MVTFNPRRTLASALAKSVRTAVRQLNLGGGTSLPGLIAEYVDPDLTRSLVSQIPNGSIVVSGTNGKTSTSHYLVKAVMKAGLEPITNPEGSNLRRGVCTSLITHTNTLGNLRASDKTIGIFEVDEGTLPWALQALSPRIVTITNLFRDQLDRYFEIDFIATLWSKSIKQLSPSSILTLNADDPQVAYLGTNHQGSILYYGIEDIRHARSCLEHASDSRHCLQCGAELLYETSYYAHLGHYVCPSCGWRRPDPIVKAWKVDLLGLEGSQVSVTLKGSEYRLNVQQPGLHNVYNALAAFSAAIALGINPQIAAEAISTTKNPFGRMEPIEIKGRKAWIALVKNPSGFNQNLRLVLASQENPILLLAINDNVPDGRDVSWIWDVDFEVLKGKPKKLMISGKRAYDLAVRLKYAEVIGDFNKTQWHVEPDVEKAFWSLHSLIPTLDPIFVLPTYTAMWSLREGLAKKRLIEPFWEHEQKWLTN